MSGHPALDVTHWDDGVPPDILIVDGNPVSVTVHSGHLLIKDGTRDKPRTRRITRSQRQIRKIVVLAQHGYVSLDAYAWMRGCDIAHVYMEEEPRYHNYQAIRGQALQRTGCARYLIERKIAGSAQNMLTLHCPQTAKDIGRILVPEDLQGIKNAEVSAARRYWKAWRENVALPWRGNDLKRIPEMWKTAQVRKVDARSYANNASDPLNAMLNYAYRVGETACYEACVVAGLNPALGILHVPQTGRDSFVLDLLEAVRPVCDARIIRLVQSMSYMDPHWVHETKSGVCRLDAPLTHTISGWQSSLFDVALPAAIESARILGRDQ